MSDVEAGGRTVFNLLGVGAAPEKVTTVGLYLFNLINTSHFVMLCNVR